MNKIIEEMPDQVPSALDWLPILLPAKMTVFTG